ncbi:acyl-CoA thioester hydrolase/BAAT C-terminal domain-containing protein [Paraburkholderia sp. ZP32-5]|uniref:acyl-CoA thioester hydrolase/BAAT C-terminal domain-containing protein n=1 Tax=Paraburkholderia sp. ZP32-5 TaxID=2883245 RepID=UPI001F21AF7B|nr:acyl-CoA thioesterase/bile acid-CoA:amino acid N-acyltransferase family protein [Paraburkholderia sp. ZP32-5]
MTTAHPVTPTLSFEPAHALIDVPRSIRLAHFSPHESVRIRASLTRADGTLWQSHAHFTAGPDGSLDLDDAVPAEGSSYRHASASGLIWSLELVRGSETPRGDEAIDSRTIEFEATSASGARATATLVQQLVADGVSRTEIRAEGLVGTLFQPAGSGPHPVVIVLNGSGGGINEARAALLAAHGFAAFALGYFQAPGRPDHISATPLEYFATAIAWSRMNLAPAHGFVALLGQSRGAELALLLGATYGSAVSAVVGYVPSSVVHGTLRAGRPGEHPASPAWTLGGQRLATVWDDNRTADWAAFNSTVSPVRQAPSFVSALRDTDAVERSRIRVENITGPVLLLSGTDDGFWPSSTMADGIVERMHAARHPYPVAHLKYEGAGHSIHFPFVPTTRIVKPHAVAKVDLSAGGTPEANARANEESWPKVVEFLRAAVAAGTRDGEVR